jgi:mRNA interferase RelE/StbE
VSQTHKNWKIVFDAGALKDLERLDFQVRAKITRFLRRVSAGEVPFSLQSKALQGKYNGLFRYRVGDKRVIFKLDEVLKVLLILEIGHRKEVYA